MDTDRLVQFLNARLGEQETLALNATAAVEQYGSWHALVEFITDECTDKWLVAAESHAFAHDPAHALAEVAAKRAIISAHPCESAHLSDTDPQRDWCGNCGAYATVPWPCDTLRLMASAYAGHESFDKAWLIDVSAAADRAHGG